MIALRPISVQYRKAAFEAIVLQILLLMLCGMILDGGDMGLMYAASLVPFWAGTAVMVWRRPQNPTWTDIQLIRFGTLPLWVMSYFLVHVVWMLLGAA